MAGIPDRMAAWIGVGGLSPTDTATARFAVDGWEEISQSMVNCIRVLFRFGIDEIY